MAAFQSPTSLVATLGVQPQVLTFMLDLLYAHDYPINQVHVVCLAGGDRDLRVRKQLMAEFDKDRYQGHACSLKIHPVRVGNLDLSELTQPVELQAVQSTFHDLLRLLKSEHHSIHLSLSGGYRTMALIAISAAMLHLKPNDRIWHLFTPRDLEDRSHDGAVMHAPPGSGVRLVEVPFVPWVAYFPAAQPFLENPTINHETTMIGWLSEEDKKNCETVWDSLRPRERDALRCYGRGMSRKKIACELSISEVTVDTYRKVIIETCRHAWAIDEGQRLDNRFLEQKFGVFLQNLNE